MKECSKCGKEMQDDSKFCTSCGEKVEGNSASIIEEAVEVTAEEKTEDTVETVAEEKTADAVEVVAEEKIEVAEEVAVEEKSELVENTTAEEKPSGIVNPMPVEEVKKTSKGKKTGIIAGAIALVAVVGTFAAVTVSKSDLFKDPKEVVIEAFKSVYEEEKVNHLDEIFGLTEMAQISTEQNTEGGLKLKFDDSSIYGTEAFIGSGIDVYGKNDIENKKSSVKIGIQYQEMDLAHIDAYLDEKEIMVAVPELSTKVFALNFADDLQGQIENSPMLGEYIQEAGIDLGAMSDYIDYVYSFEGNEEEIPFNLGALWERYKTGSQAIDNLKAAMTVQKGKKEVKVVDGKEENCRTYEAVIAGDAMIDFLRTSSDFFLEDETLKRDVLEYLTQVIQLSGGLNPYSYGYFSEDPTQMRDEVWDEAEMGMDELLDELEKIVEDDIRMLVYVDSKGRLAAFEAETKLSADEDLIDTKLIVALEGGDYLTQNSNMELTMSHDDTGYTMAIEKEGSFDGNVLLGNITANVIADDVEYGKMTYSGSYQVDNGDYLLEVDLNAGGNAILFTMEGIVSELEKGKTIEAIADSIRIEVDEDYLELSGSYSFKPLEGEVTVPEGDQMDILAATESDWTGVAMEIYMKAMELASKLQ